MTWQYRVMRKKLESGKFSYGLYEYYKNTGEGKLWTADAMEPAGETLEELKADYKLMAEAFRAPVLDQKTGKPIRAK